MKKYAITGIENCQLTFYQGPLFGPGSGTDIFRHKQFAMQLAMWPYQDPDVIPGEFTGPVKNTRITFFNFGIADSVGEESLDQVSIAKSIDTFEDFYKNLSEAVIDKNSSATLITISDSVRTIPYFDFNGE